MPEISGDDAAQKWMWWQRLGFFKPKRLMQFGKFTNTGEIGYNLCLAALYCRRRGCLPGKTTTDSTLFLCTILDKDFCKHQFGVAKSAHQARLDLQPPRRSPSKLWPILLRSSCFFQFCWKPLIFLLTFFSKNSFLFNFDRKTFLIFLTKTSLSKKIHFFSQNHTKSLIFFTLTLHS